MGKLPWPKGLAPEVCRISILPFPVDALPKPLRSSLAAMRTLRVAGPFDTSIFGGLILKMTNGGGLVWLCGTPMGANTIIRVNASALNLGRLHPANNESLRSFKLAQCFRTCGSDREPLGMVFKESGSI